MVDCAGGVFFVVLQRKSGVYHKNPIFRRLAMASTDEPLRDLGLAVACFAVTLIITFAIVMGLKHGVLPDNYVTAGILIVVTIAGIASVMWFMFGVIMRVFYGPPPT
jgi:hypothetical protein